MRAERLGALRFAAVTEGWPADVRDHARRLAADSFGGLIPQSRSRS
jgi:hypothetical protein